MGTKLPRAGCPVVNLRRTLRDLTDAGLSVVVCEELAPVAGHPEDVPAYETHLFPFPRRARRPTSSC